MSCPVAVNAWTPPTATVTGFGVTIIWCSEPGKRVTDAMPLAEPLVAVTVPEPEIVCAVKKPEESTKPMLVVHVKVAPETRLP